jgi:hypothetical protein
VILDDTRSPERVHIAGAYRLSDELMSAGTVPQVAKGRRLCSIHGKGWPLDAWLDANIPGQFRHVIGFNAEETKRVTRDKSYSTVDRHSEYPLLEWGWGRKACEDYLEDLFGEPWEKSCCVYCPFAAGKEPVRLRYRANPMAAAFALLLEHMSLCLNPRMTLYSNKSLLEVLKRDGNDAAIALFERNLGGLGSAVYHVRRIYTAKAHADRSVEPVARGTMAEMERAIERIGPAMEDKYGILRLTTIEREPDTYPSLEEMFVVGPDLVPEKKKATFDRKWEAALAGRVSEPSAALSGSIGDPASELDPDRREQEAWESEMVSEGVLPPCL